MIFVTLKNVHEKSPKLKKPETITMLSGIGCFVIIANRDWLEDIGEFLVCGHNWKFWVKDSLPMLYSDGKGKELDDCDDLEISGCNFLVLPNEHRQPAEDQLDQIWRNSGLREPVNLPPVFLKCGLCKRCLAGDGKVETINNKPEFVIYVERCRCVDKSENDE